MSSHWDHTGLTTQVIIGKCTVFFYNEIRMITQEGIILFFYIKTDFRIKQ